MSHYFQTSKFNDVGDFMEIWYPLSCSNVAKHTLGPEVGNTKEEPVGTKYRTGDCLACTKTRPLISSDSVHELTTVPGTPAPTFQT